MAVSPLTSPQPGVSENKQFTQTDYTLLRTSDAAPNDDLSSVLFSAQISPILISTSCFISECYLAVSISCLNCQYWLPAFSLDFPAPVE